MSFIAHALRSTTLHGAASRAAVPLLMVGALATVSLPANAVSPQRTSSAVAAVPDYRNAALPIPARVADLISRMTLDEKIGQMTQAERIAVVPSDLTSYGIGSLLSGGGSAPSPNTATSWADMNDGYQRAAASSRLGIPLIYGIDAVHGNNNVWGATIFPHNSALGATRDPALVQSIGRAVAEEVAGTGIRWDFAPCLCVARDDRWGRTYESFGETPDLVSMMTTLITGLQGSSLSDPASVAATAKHFVGDGGTTGGDDEGNTQISEAELRAIHLPPFQAAIRAGVASVMVSYSSWNGLKMHANKYLVTDVLKGELGFTGFVVSDWAAIDQIDHATDFTAAEVATSINAGLDMIMVPKAWQRFMGYLRADVLNGAVPMSRIDDANRRILTKKFELGLFEHPYTDRSLTTTVGSAAHRALAAQAVRESQVLLKNRYDHVLPLPKSPGKLFVAGKSADNLGYQSGGWTIQWQGGSGPIIPGTTILQGIKDEVTAGTQVTYDRYGNGIDPSYRAAIVVVGEKPYTEGVGDRPDDLRLDAEDLSTIARLKATGVPVVVVLVAGRPLNITAEIDGWDAALAAWLPGSEGQGVADVLFGDYAPTGTLPFTWPASEAQEPINVGDGKVGLFPFGYGLSYVPAQSAYASIGSAYWDENHGTRLEACLDAKCGRALAFIKDGDSVGYSDVDFGSVSPATVLTRIASGAGSVTGTITYRLDSVDGPTIATVPVASTGGWQQWTTVTTAVAPVTGKHRIYQTFSGPTAADFVNVNWFRFQR